MVVFWWFGRWLEAHCSFRSFVLNTHMVQIAFLCTCLRKENTKSAHCLCATFEQPLPPPPSLYIAGVQHSTPHPPHICTLPFLNIRLHPGPHCLPHPALLPPWGPRPGNSRCLGWSVACGVAWPGVEVGWVGASGGWHKHEFGHLSHRLPDSPLPPLRHTRQNDV